MRCAWRPTWWGWTATSPPPCPSTRCARSTPATAVWMTNGIQGSACVKPRTPPHLEVVKGRGLLPGAHVGPYEVIRPLGRGGMARVYVARSPDRPDVALKVLEPEF